MFSNHLDFSHSMKTQRLQIGTLKISKDLFDFVNEEVFPLPNTNINSERFWLGVEKIIHDFAYRNRILLTKRDRLQDQIDQWHRTHPIHSMNIEDYKKFLYDIGYLVPADTQTEFSINTTDIDDEIAKLASPQLVVPLLNARFVLNATNARWGSLYDALYGTDFISDADGCQQTTEYNPTRGEKVIKFVRNFLDETVPLVDGFSHSNAIQYFIESDTVKVISHNLKTFDTLYIFLLA